MMINHLHIVYEVFAFAVNSLVGMGLSGARDVKAFPG